MGIPKYVMENIRNNDRLLLAAATALAEAAIEIHTLDADEGLDEAGVGHGDWLEETRKLLFEIADYLPADALTCRGTFTELGSHLAGLEGWNIFDGGDGVCGEIQRDDEDRMFESDDAALEHVKARAESNEIGTKLHAMALAIHTNDGKRPFRASSRRRKSA